MSETERNNLYPVFLKAGSLHFLIVGGGNVGLEKLSFLVKSSPDAKVTMVAPWFLDETLELAAKHNVTIIKRKYRIWDLKNKHVVVATTDRPDLNKKIWASCRKRHKLVNVADTPEACDFYMGGIVTKGNLKIAISTNGKSPTFAKRLRQFFEESLPENTDDLLKNLNEYRKTLMGDFEEKVNKLNDFTKSLVSKDKD